MSQFDAAAAALVLVFAWAGYQRGLLSFVVHLAGGVLAFALAAALAPFLVPHIVGFINVPALFVRPAALIAVAALLRLVFGFAIRELAGAARVIVRAIPPLALVDRVLGIVPGVALGALFVTAWTVVALTLPAGSFIHDTAAASWVAQHVVTQPQEALAVVRRLWEDLILTPPRPDTLPLAAGVGGLWVGAFAAYRMRGSQTVRRALRAAPSRPAARPVAVGETGTADPLAVPRAALGLTAAGIIALALLLIGRLRVGL